MRFNNCVFDFYGTLADIRTDEEKPELWEEMAELYASRGAVWSPSELKEAYFRTVREAERGAEPLRRDSHEAHPEIKLEYVFQSLYAQKGVEASPELGRETGVRFREASMEYLRLYDGARELLSALRGRGQKIYLLSNAQAIFTRRELDALGITSEFDGIYLSSDYGVKKPDRRFFEILLNERGLDPKDTVMVGNDGVCDIEGAKGLGLSTVYIRSNISPREPMPQADYVLPTMDLTCVREILTSD